MLSPDQQADRKYAAGVAVVTDALFRVRATPPPGNVRLNGIVLAATEQVRLLGEKLVHRIHVSCLTPDLGHLAITEVIDQDLVIVQLPARSLATDST
jgi:hypothetical protein